MLMALAYSAVSPAGCINTDTLGGWKVYFSFPPQWVACDIGVWFGGEITGGTCTRSNGVQSPVTGGKFSVDKKCDIEGEIITTDIGMHLQTGRMDLTKLNGQGVSMSYAEILGTFSAVKK